MWQARSELHAKGLTREEAADRIGVQPNQVTNLLRDGKLLALDGPDGLRLPAWRWTVMSNASSPRRTTTGRDRGPAGGTGEEPAGPAERATGRPLLAHLAPFATHPGR